MTNCEMSIEMLPKRGFETSSIKKTPWVCFLSALPVPAEISVHLECVEIQIALCLVVCSHGWVVKAREYRKSWPFLICLLCVRTSTLFMIVFLQEHLANDLESYSWRGLTTSSIEMVPENESGISVLFI